MGKSLGLPDRSIVTKLKNNMIYSIALTFNKETGNQIKDFYNKIKDNLDLEFGLEENSIPHITIIKFESQSELTKNELGKISDSLELDINIDFSGITLLPSHSEGHWIELSVLKNRQLVKIQNELITRLKNYKILSGIGDRFRPHITFAKTKNGKINLENLDYSILRKKQVKVKIVIQKL